MGATEITFHSSKKWKILNIDAWYNFPGIQTLGNYNDALSYKNSREVKNPNKFVPKFLGLMISFKYLKSPKVLVQKSDNA